jgi:hypothetical protein
MCSTAITPEPFQVQSAPECKLVFPASADLSCFNDTKADRSIKKVANHESVEDDFNTISNFDFLTEDGWKKEGETSWTRPGKSNGISAGIVRSKDDIPLLHIFTSAAPPFESDHNYSPFDAYALLKHGGDRKAARADLAKQGFGGVRIPLITSKELDRGAYELTYLIKGILVLGQPCIIAGPKKALKTSILIALAVALAAGLRFLGHFIVTAPVKVVILSGESGMATLQETARRICQSMKVCLSGIDDLLWSDFLPRFDNPQHLAGLERMLRETGCKVLIIDPAYLAMPGTDAANLFIQGTLLRQISDLCQRNGVGLILAHHTRKKGRVRNSSDYDPPELDDMAWAGFSEFARQWLLIGRRGAYEPGTGEHKLWLSVGGSAGHSGLWAVNVDEGPSGAPRHWNVELLSPDEAREQKKSGTIRDRILDAMKNLSLGDTKSVIFGVANLKSSVANRAVFDSLIEEGVLVPCRVKKSTQSYEGYRLASVRGIGQARDLASLEAE